MEKDSKKNRSRFETEAVIHTNALYRTALRMTRNEDDASDLVQEALVKAYRFWDKYEEGSNARAWLFKIMTNIFINNYRSKSRAPQTVAYEEIDDNFLFGQLATIDPSDNPERNFFAKVFDDDVKKAIEELPPDFRIVVILSFLEGFSYQEIADIAGLNIGTVKSRLHRGRKILQKSLWDYALRNGFISKRKSAEKDGNDEKGAEDSSIEDSGEKPDHNETD
ncbi:MAG: sigma-70 family RNA polymerase sigma factor [candidate division Zixibacteria bacterium]|nr:sigma-70 family RNA polymerase sigma factor [candidate division Zixibacteria bacterium]